MVKIKTCRDLITLCEKTQNPVTTVMGKRESAQEQDRPDKSPEMLQRYQDQIETS